MIGRIVNVLTAHVQRSTKTREQIRDFSATLKMLLKRWKRSSAEHREQLCIDREKSSSRTGEINSFSFIAIRHWSHSAWLNHFNSSTSTLGWLLKYEDQGSWARYERIKDMANDSAWFHWKEEESSHWSIDVNSEERKKTLSGEMSWSMRRVFQLWEHFCFVHPFDVCQRV